MFEYIIFPAKSPTKSLIVFLHGYNDCVSYHQGAYELMRQNLPNSLLVAPEAPEICDKNSQKRQWFGMIKYDPENRRNFPSTSVPQIFKIYRQAEPEIDLRAHQINQFIDSLQKKYKISDSETFLIGFSQGAMLALYSALCRNHPLGGAFILSGLAAGRNLLHNKIKSNPPIFLFHGKNDLKVQYKTLKSTAHWLKKHQITPHIFTYKNLAHTVTAEEIKTITQIIGLKNNFS